jgi:hypothetical protein
MNATSTISEDLPALYRSILDLIAELERCGGRVEAARVRRQVLEAYARGWDTSLQLRLGQTHERLLRSIDAHQQPARRRLRRP